MSELWNYVLRHQAQASMKAPLYPRNEAERIRALHDLLILDTEPEERFDVITTYCQSRFNVEIALVSLVDTDRQWFKSACGLAAKETPRNISFCGHAILQEKVMVVGDALEDERFRDNPLVIGPPHIRFYAGAPLKLSNGHLVGTLCLIDPKPHRPDPEEIKHLSRLAHVVSMELEHMDPLQDCKDHCLYGLMPEECFHKDIRSPFQ